MIEIKGYISRDTMGILLYNRQIFTEIIVHGLPMEGVDSEVTLNIESPPGINSEDLLELINNHIPNVNPDQKADLALGIAHLIDQRKTEPLI